MRWDWIVNYSRGQHGVGGGWGGEVLKTLDPGQKGQQVSKIGMGRKVSGTTGAVGVLFICKINPACVWRRCAVGIFRREDFQLL